MKFRDVFRLGLVMAVIALTVPAMVFAAGAAEPAATEARTIELSAATINPGGSHLGQTLAALARRIEEKSGGRIEVTVYPDGQLGDASTLYESVARGNIDIIMSDTGWFAEEHPQFDVLEASYLFRDEDHYLELLNTPGSLSYFENLLLERPGLRTLMYAGGMERNIISTFPINRLSDLRGRTMRSRPVSTELEWWELLGARPIPVSFQETYTAIQTGVVEGSQNSLDAMINMRFMEVAKNVARTQQGIHLGMIVMNNQRFESLDSDLQRAILDAAAEVQPEYLQRAFDDAENLLARLQNEFGVRVTDPDKGPFIEASRKQLWDLAQEIGIESTVRDIFD